MAAPSPTRCWNASWISPRYFPSTASYAVSGLQLRLSSYGDSIIAACARTENIDLVITRNTEPFLSLGIPASTPDEFIEELGFTAIDLGAL